MSEFIRWKEVDILMYLPFFIANAQEFKAINDADSLEHERMRLLLIELLKQGNIQTATYALTLWESFLGISSIETDINNRRIAIIEKLNRNESSTQKFLEKLANQFIADNSAKITPYNEKYTVDIKFNRDMCVDLEKLQEELDTYKPAHIGYQLWEDTLINHNILVAGTPVYEEDILIETIKPLQIEDMNIGIYFGSALSIEEDMIIGGI